MDVESAETATGVPLDEFEDRNDPESDSDREVDRNERANQTWESTNTVVLKANYRNDPPVMFHNLVIDHQGLVGFIRRVRDQYRWRISWDTCTLQDKKERAARGQYRNWDSPGGAAYEYDETKEQNWVDASPIPENVYDATEQCQQVNLIMQTAERYYGIKAKDWMSDEMVDRDAEAMHMRTMEMMKVVVRKAFDKPKISFVYHDYEKNLRKDTFYADPFTMLQKARVIPSGYVLKAIDQTTSLVTRFGTHPVKLALEKYLREARRPLAIEDREEPRRSYDRAPQPYGGRGSTSYVPSASSTQGWYDRSSWGSRWRSDDWHWRPL
jgi:hypothetical protein